MKKTYPAIQFSQNGHILYLLTVDAKNLADIAVVPKLAQGEEGLSGYQRDEIKGHIKTISTYLNINTDAMIPNSLILAYDEPPKFTPIEKPEKGFVGPLLGTITIGKLGEVVDGQQRSAAIRESTLESFMMPVVAFVVGSEAEKAEHFVRVNSSKPLSRSIINTLLPHLDTEITAAMEKRKIPAILVERLNTDVDSELQGWIKTALNKDGIATDSTFITAFEDSLTSGALFRFRAEGDLDGMATLLKNYWAAVRSVFKESWNLSSTKESRLLTSSGVSALMFFLDNLIDVTTPTSKYTKNYFTRELKKIAPACAWHSGEWDFGPDGRRFWSSLESTRKSANILKAHLLRVWKSSNIKIKDEELVEA